jgi:hypothetical protein
VPDCRRPLSPDPLTSVGGIISDRCRWKIVTAKLFFNGVNATSGQYGLAPMSIEDLANHVMADWAGTRQQRMQLRKTLERRVANEQKVQAIVEFLVTDIVRSLSENGGAAGDWYVEAARQLLTIILGDVGVVGSGDVLLLTDRLRADPVQVITSIVKGLSTGQSTALAEWLLGQGNEARAALRGSLDARFDQALVAIQRAYLLDGRTSLRDAQGCLDAVWIDGFIQDLEQLPVESLRVLLDTDIVVAAHRRLTHDLEAVPELQESHMRVHPALHALRVALFSAEGSQSWRGLLARLHDLLMAIRQAGLILSDEELRQALGGWLDELRRRVTGHLGVVSWVNPCDLAQTGWGIVFPARMPKSHREAVQEALSPLLNWRRAQAGELFFIFADAEGYRPGETAGEFLRRPPRRAAAANPADPANTGVPYYLLLIGSPEEISFEFQYQLDVQYAVGRLDFGEDLEAYGAYARNVLAAEHASFRHSSQVVFFGTEHQGDEATSLSATHLIRPLAERAEERANHTGCRVLRVDPAKATKRNLIKLLQLDPPPALLFTATHGLEFDSGHPDQRRRQGALLCQDWEGTSGEIRPQPLFRGRGCDPYDELARYGAVFLRLLRRRHAAV